MYKLTNKFISTTLSLIILGCFTASANAAGENRKAFGYSDRYGVVTPTQVYSLVQSYDALFNHYVKTHKRGASSRVNAIKLKPASGKTPEDAFGKLNRLSDSLDKLLSRAGLEPTARITREKKKAIPAEVFLQAGNCLDALIKYMVKKNPEKQWGDFYAVHEYSKAKSPSDVYAFADLSIRQLDATLR